MLNETCVMFLDDTNDWRVDNANDVTNLSLGMCHQTIRLFCMSGYDVFSTFGKHFLKCCLKRRELLSINARYDMNQSVFP